MQKSEKRQRAQPEYINDISAVDTLKYPLNLKHRLPSLTVMHCIRALPLIQHHTYVSHNSL
jgi:hypothetical protein